MYEFLDFMIDLGKFIFFVLVGFLIFILFVVFASEIENRNQKKECYEIYATDNVKLKKCEKYFEKRED